MRLGVNIDHVATLREARKGKEPDLLRAAKIACDCGADQITVHLRMDRRHIQDRDLYALKDLLTIPLNVEMSTTDEMLAIAKETRPDKVTLVPEREDEVTTEGGLCVIKSRDSIARFIKAMEAQNTKVGIFIDPTPEQVRGAAKLGVDEIEINTGTYADHSKPEDQGKELERIRETAILASELKLVVAAGHGLRIENLSPVLAIGEIEELNIGHHIIADAVFLGLENKLKDLMKFIGEHTR